MGGSAHMSFTVGSIFAVGGAIGYIKKKSLPSLIAGLGLGSLMIISGLVIQRGRDFDGHALALATSATAAGVMGVRAARTGKFMPAGLVAGVSGLCALYQGKKTYEWR